jgi:hypothetical protein
MAVLTGVVPAAPGGREQGAGTVRTYAEAALWFATAHLLRETGKTRWEQVAAQDAQRWIAGSVFSNCRTRLSTTPAEMDVLRDIHPDPAPISTNSDSAIRSLACRNALSHPVTGRRRKP